MADPGMEAEDPRPSDEAVRLIHDAFTERRASLIHRLGLLTVQPGHARMHGMVSHMVFDA